MAELTERDALVALAHCVEPADAAVGRLLEQCGASALVEQIAAGRSTMRNGEGLRARLVGFEPAAAEERAVRCDARIVTRLDREWPTQLDALGHRAPFALWVRGPADLRLLALRSLAVVGARACTPYGEEIARTWAADLAARRWSVLSGGAFGIDAAAHRGALVAGGTTVAVMAGGVDVAYPRAHEALLARVLDDGLVVSETPPGESVRRQRFLSRNRLIAAMSRATLVIEAAERSGTAATAHAAAELNRPVLAVPGPVTSPASAGCHRMIREGTALLVADLADVLDLLELGSGASGPGGARASSPAPASTSAGQRAAVDALALRERRVLDAFPGRAPIDLDALVRSAGLGRSDVLAAVGLLVVAGLVEDDGGAWRRPTPRSPRA